MNEKWYKVEVGIIDTTHARVHVHTRRGAVVSGAAVSCEVMRSHGDGGGGGGGEGRLVSKTDEEEEEEEK